MSRWARWSPRAQFDKIQALIQKGIDEGATLVAGGTGRPEGLDKGYYVKPTVFANVTNDMTIAREEIFGPVLAILGYDSVDQAIEIANDTEYRPRRLRRRRGPRQGARRRPRDPRRAGWRSTTASTSTRRSAATRRAATGASGASSASTSTWRPRRSSATRLHTAS